MLESHNSGLGRNYLLATQILLLRDKVADIYLLKLIIDPSRVFYNNFEKESNLVMGG